MALLLVAITQRSPRRIRLSFDHTLASGAFSTTPYVVSNTDAKGPDPAIREALAVPNSPHVVELVLSLNLVGGALYQVTCTAVPDTEPATFTGSMSFETSTPAPAPSVTITLEDIDRLLYGSDIFWNGEDFVEAPNGDLARISGVPNVEASTLRRIDADGLPWEPNYGGKARAAIDAPTPSLRSLRGQIQRDLLRDDRYEAVTVSVDLDDNSGKPSLSIEPVLIGNRQFAIKKDIRTQ